MKKTILIAAGLLGSFLLPAQDTKREHTIKVVGTAEMEIVPDEIYMTITLKEYTKDKKKYTIEDLEKSLVNYLDKVTGTAKADVKMDNMDACIIKMKRKNKDEVITKKYDIKFKNSQQVYLLYSVMDSLGIVTGYISKYSHSKMDEYKKQIKINAIKAAREKANYLLLSINETAGKAVSVSERTGYVTVDDGIYDNRYNNAYGNSYSQSMSRGSWLENNKTESFGSDTVDETIGGKTIKLHYEIDAEFLIN